MHRHERRSKRRSSRNLKSKPPVTSPASGALILNSAGYLEAPGVNVMNFSDAYPEGHQSGVTIILNGSRIAANGDVRLDPVPGQWQPIPRLEERVVDVERQTITARLSYPDPSRNRTGFNPIEYPDLCFQYQVKVMPDAASFRIMVDLSESLPEEWQGKVAFNLELFPGDYFGKSWFMDATTGTFPRQLIGPYTADDQQRVLSQPLAKGTRLSVAPETQDKHLTIEGIGVNLELLDGTVQHNNGWYIVRSELDVNKTTRALEWKLTPHPQANWMYGPVIHVSQVGYHPDQSKLAVVELDPWIQTIAMACLVRIDFSGARVEVKRAQPKTWGRFSRYNYVQFDFTEVCEAGIYLVSYADTESNIFRIGTDVYSKGVWQPTLEYFLPVQMCHMRINDRYRVWHGLCHMDDARMAPTNTVHFDGYAQGSDTLTRFESLQFVPGLCVGGWHDAGDYDLRIESQMGTVRMLALAYEAFRPDYDATTIDQTKHIVEMHRPDGTPDMLQQIEHGVLSVLGGYRNLGRLYRGIICPTLRQYVLLGDATNSTDNCISEFNVGASYLEPNRAPISDDRWVFTEQNPARELSAVAGLALCARILSGYNASLARECGQAAESLYGTNRSADGATVICPRIEALAELILLTERDEYKSELVALLPDIVRHIDTVGWALGRLNGIVNDQLFHLSINGALVALRTSIRRQCAETPFGIPYHPAIWGSGWAIQSFGVRQFYLHAGWPDLFDTDYLLNALNFVLGTHPGANTSSFVSGVGAQSMTTAYGLNRADFSYVPGGVVSGTSLIAPDFPELKDWPYLWQQGEYMIGAGACDFMFLALAADNVLNNARRCEPAAYEAMAQFRLQ